MKTIGMIVHQRRTASVEVVGVLMGVSWCGLYSVPKQ
jgi:hypothetical protein